MKSFWNDIRATFRNLRTGRGSAPRYEDPNQKRIRSLAKLTRPGIGGVSGIGGSKMNGRLKT